MNRISLIGLLLLLTTLLAAQVDNKYLTDAVPLVDGKVTFTREIKVNAKVSNEQLFELAKDWMNKEFAEKDGSLQRVLLSNKPQSYIVAQGDEKLVFKSQVFMLDQANMTYQLIVRTESGSCSLEVRNIKYEYQDYKDLMPAEEMITDKMALHKDGEKLNRHYDKFRTFTIDRVDELRASLLAHLSEVSVKEIKTTEQGLPVAPSITDVEELPQPAPSIKVEGSPAVSVAQPMPVASKGSQTTPMIPLVPAQKVGGMVGYKEMKASELTEDVMAMFKDNWILVTTGQGENSAVMTGAWSGIGNFGSKPVAMTVVDSKNNSEETYTISFYTPIHRSALSKLADGEKSALTPVVTPSGAKAFAEAWMVIECKKVLEQPATDSMKKDIQSKEWEGKDFDKLFMGEILNVWAR